MPDLFADVKSWVKRTKPKLTDVTLNVQLTVDGKNMHIRLTVPMMTILSHANIRGEVYNFLEQSADHVAAVVAELKESAVITAVS